MGVTFLILDTLAAWLLRMAMFVGQPDGLSTMVHSEKSLLIELLD